MGNTVIRPGDILVGGVVDDTFRVRPIADDSLECCFGAIRNGLHRNHFIIPEKVMKIV